MTARRRIAIGVAGVLAVAIGVVASVSGGRGRRPPPRRSGGCTCSGYIWHGLVTSVSATWRVPALAGSTVGSASTWIGTSDGRNAFIQIGIEEERRVPAGDAKQLPPVTYPTYKYAFWSDTAHALHPLYLGLVQPGDRVRASLSWAGGRWWLRLVDRQALLAVHFSTTDESGYPMIHADWLQEDNEADAKTGRLFPYPQLSAVVFRDMRVNGTPPARPQLSSRQMSPPSSGLTFTPSRLYGDGDAFVINAIR